MTLEQIIRRRFPCIGDRFCDGRDDCDRGHALGCPAVYRFRAELVIKDIEKNRKRIRR